MRTFFGKKEPITDTHELLRQIERKDAAFRVTQFVFFIVALIFLGALLVSNYRLQSEDSNLLASQSKALKELQQTANQLKQNDKNTAASFADLQQHIDCIVNLFTQPNRANLTITNIQGCQLSASASGGSTGSTKSRPVSAAPQSKISNNTESTPQSSSPPPTTPVQPTPKQPLLCTLTFHLFGCK